MYVARFSEDITWDIERGFSSFGFEYARKTDEEVVELFDASLLDAEAIESAQARRITADGDNFDEAAFVAEYVEVTARRLAAFSGLVRDDKYRSWSPFHHDGLSCWKLADDLYSALVTLHQVCTFNADLAQQTVGEVTYVTSVEVGGAQIHILHCADAVEEQRIW